MLHYKVLFIKGPDKTRDSSQKQGCMGDIVWSASSLQQEAFVFLTWKMNQTPFSPLVCVCVFVWACYRYHWPQYINIATSYQKRLNWQYKKRSISECEKRKACGCSVQTHGTFLSHNLLFKGLSIKISLHNCIGYTHADCFHWRSN